MKKSRTSQAIATTLIAIMTATQMHAQQIALISDNEVFPIEEQQTQTEIKAGWKIVDIQLKSTMQRYLWGTTAKQYTHDICPKFAINTDTLLLSDLVLIKLKRKKLYRKIQKPTLQDNECIYVDFSTFRIEPYEEESFQIQPIKPLEPGEYIFTWSTITPVGSLEDWIVWPFCIK